MTRLARRILLLRAGRPLSRKAQLGLATLGALVLFSTPAPRPASAQGNDCNSLRAQIAALDRASTRANPYAGTIRSQRAGLERAEDYGRKLGCDRHGFIFFGPPPPPQCGQVNAQIAQLRASLSQLEANARGVVDSPQRQQMVASYNAYCRQQTATQGGFLGGLFGGPNANPGSPDLDVPPAPDALPAPDVAATPTGGSELLCVRHCDGAFFPINYAPARDNETLTEFCKASCPSAEVSVFSRVPGQDIQTAVGLDGKPYMSLPGALKYQKTLDSSCTCRAAGTTWAQTLANAEAMLSHSKKGEIVVTQQKSDEMARPTASATADSKKKHKANGEAAATDSGDDIIKEDAAAAAQVPTASTDTAGISAVGVNNQTSYPQGAGPTADVTGADGVKRHVRIVGPQP